jgi:xylulose-5-phosphate/fructose-6-phosphate phosphoketolase
VIDRVPRLSAVGAYAKQEFRDRLIEHRQYIQRVGDDPPAIRDWTWRRPKS